MAGVKRARDGAVRIQTLDEPGQPEGDDAGPARRRYLTVAHDRASAPKEREWPGQARP